MTIESAGTMACPHCGGEIKAVAKVCKHCKRDVDQPSADGDVTAASTNPAPVLRDLRAFVLGRGLLRAEQLDPLLAQHPDVDAAVLLGHLAAAGYIAPVQVESQREGFRASQESRAVGVLRVATDRGLLTPAHVEQALASYRGVVFQQSLDEYLTTAGLLTPAQVTDLQRSASPGGRFLADARSRWAQAPQSRRRIVYWGAALLGAVVVINMGLAVVDELRGHADIVQNSTMDGWGRGASTFTNRGRRAGSMCGHIFVNCGRGSRSSETFCSGTVAPNETKRVEFNVTGMDRIGTYGRDWRDDCDFGFSRESGGE